MRLCHPTQLRTQHRPGGDAVGPCAPRGAIEVPDAASSLPCCTAGMGIVAKRPGKHHGLVPPPPPRHGCRHAHCAVGVHRSPLKKFSQLSHCQFHYQDRLAAAACASVFCALSPPSPPYQALGREAPGCRREQTSCLHVNRKINKSRLNHAELQQQKSILIRGALRPG